MFQDQDVGEIEVAEKLRAADFLVLKLWKSRSGGSLSQNFGKLQKIPVLKAGWFDFIRLTLKKSKKKNWLIPVWSRDAEVV